MESNSTEQAKRKKAINSPLEKAVKETVRAKGTSVSALSKAADIDESTFYKMFKSGSASAETLEKIATQLGEDSSYFFKYNGLPPYEKVSSSIGQVSASDIVSSISEEEAHLYVPFYDVDVTAGNFTVFSDFVDTPAGYIYAPEFIGCVACKVRGDSMYKRIMPGATVFIQKLESKKYIDYGQIYLLVLEGLRPVKYIFPHDDEDRVLLVSENQEKFPSWSVEKADILHLFLVKGYLNQNAN